MVKVKRKKYIGKVLTFLVDCGNIYTQDKGQGKGQISWGVPLRSLGTPLKDMAISGCQLPSAPPIKLNKKLFKKRLTKVEKYGILYIVKELRP